MAMERYQWQGGAEQHSGCCKHEGCIPLRAHRWCETWFFLSLVASTHMECDEMMDKVADLCGPGGHEFYATASVGTGRNSYDVLVRQTRCKRLDTDDGSLYSKLTMNGFDGDMSSLHALRCCERALRWNVEFWLRRLEPTPARMALHTRGGATLKAGLKQEADAALETLLSSSTEGQEPPRPPGRRRFLDEGPPVDHERDDVTGEI